MLVVYCHPVADSFCAALRDSATRTLGLNGHDVRVRDLYAMGFDPVLGREERLNYHTAGQNEQPVSEHLEDLKWCEGILFVYPTWWYGPPAMLKGWLDRVWIPHATFDMPEKGKPIRPILTHIRFIGAISTLGSPWWWWRIVMGEPGRRIMLRGLRPLVSRRCRTLWVALHDMDSATASDREAFLKRVQSAVASIA